MARIGRGRGMLPGVIGLDGGTGVGVAQPVSIAQTAPAFTQAVVLAHVTRTAVGAQTLPAFTQAVTGASAGLAARQVLLTYLVLEVPDTPLLAAAAQTLAPFTQAGVLAQSQGGFSVQTLAAFTQTGTLTFHGAIAVTQTLAPFTQTGTVVKTGLTARATQTLSAFTQTLDASMVGGIPARATYTWRGPVIARTWRGLRRRT